MNLDRSLQAAREATKTTAPRIYNNIEAELSLSSAYTEEQSDQAEEALALLEERFPGVHRQARDVTAPPSLSRGASRAFGGEPPARSRKGGRDGEDAPRVVLLRPPSPALWKRAIPLLVIATLFLLVYGVAKLVPSAGDCGGGSSYENTSLEEICQMPSGSVRCVISSYGFSPSPRDSQYVRRPPSGPWCKNAHS